MRLGKKYIPCIEGRGGCGGAHIHHKSLVKCHLTVVAIVFVARRGEGVAEEVGHDINCEHQKLHISGFGYVVCATDRLQVQHSEHDRLAKTSGHP